MLRFFDFNQRMNPFNDKVYFSHTEYLITKKRRYLSFYDLTALIKANDIPDLEIAYELPEHLILVTTKDSRLVDSIAKTRSINAYILKMKGVYQCVFKKTSDLKSLNEYTTNVLTNASVTVRTEKVKPFIVLPYKSSTNTSFLLNHIDEIYAVRVGEIDNIPFEFKPIVNKSFTNLEETYPIKSDTQQHFSRIITKIKNIVPTYEDVCNIINAINIIYCEDPLTDEEITEMFNSDLVIDKSFVSDGTILYDVIAHHFINKHYIKYDASDNNLYYYDELKKVYINDDKHLKSIINVLLPFLKTPQIDEVMETIRRITYVSRVEFNKEEFNVLFKNGLFNLTDLKFKSDLDPTVLETNQINATFYMDSALKPNPFVDNFFDVISCHDKDVVKLMYEAIGYSMFRSSRFQVAFLCYGVGQNGKSTMFDLIKNVVGKENATNVSFKDLSNNFRPSLLEKKLVSIAPDISSSNTEDSDYMKSVIAGDDITIEKKNKDAYVKPVYATMWFGCNKLPRTSDNTHGFYRRFIVIPMKADLSGISRGDGKKFYEKLMTQENIDYTANRAVRAFYEVFYKTNEFTIPAVVQHEIDYYKLYSDTVRQFIKDQIDGGQIQERNVDKWNAEVLYEQYKAFCLSRGNQVKAFANYELSFQQIQEEIRRKMKSHSTSSSKGSST